MRSIAGAFLVLTMLLASGAEMDAQDLPRDGQVLSGGIWRLGVAMDYTHFDSRFASDGTEPWAADLRGPLNASTFAPLATLRSRLAEFFTASGGAMEIPADALSLGAPDLDVSADTRWVPMELAVGLLPRIEIALMLPLYRSELQVSRFDLLDGTVGLNPDPAGNAAALAAFGSEFEALGAATLLPLRGSVLGAAMLERVEAAGGELVLPDSAATDAALNTLLAQELGIPRIESSREPWRVGDLRAYARFRIISTFGEHAYPADSAGVHYRVSASLGARLPTGSEPDTLRLFSPVAAVGLTGWSAALAGDLFLGRRLWLATAASYSAAGSVDVLRRVSPPAERFTGSDPPQLVTWSPPTELRVRVSPRWRLEEAIVLGLELETISQGNSSFSGAGGAASVLDVPAGTSSRVGGSVRFTTLPASERGARVVPFEAALSLRRTVSGPAGYPQGTSFEVVGRIQHRLWGGQPQS